MTRQAKNVLKLSHTSYSNCVCTAFVGLVALEQPGPPYQLITNHTQQRREEAANTGAKDDIKEDLKSVE